MAPISASAVLGPNDRWGDWLLCALALCCLVGTSTLWASEWLAQELSASWGSGMITALSAETSLALAAFGLPTIAMGAVFSHFSARAHAAQASFGRSIAVNTSGAAIVPLLFGVLLAPALGPKMALLIVPLGYLALTSRSAWRSAFVLIPIATTVAAMVLMRPLAFVDVPVGGRVISYRDGALAAVSVVEDAEGVSRLRINNRQQEGSSSSLFADGRQALLPVLLHPNPKHALFLGLGTGMTASSATLDPVLQVDAVELLPEVIEASKQFSGVFERPIPQSHLHLIASDARR
jgi:spermidine synthase